MESRRRRARLIRRALCLTAAGVVAAICLGVGGGTIASAAAMGWLGVAGAIGISNHFDRELDAVHHDLSRSLRSGSEPPLRLRYLSTARQANALREALHLNLTAGRTIRPLKKLFDEGMGRPGEIARDLELVRVLLEFGLVVDAVELVEPREWPAEMLRHLTDTPRLSLPDRMAALTQLIELAGARLAPGLRVVVDDERTPAELTQIAQTALNGLQRVAGGLTLPTAEAGSLTAVDDG